jgi:hypothetical protein
MGCDEPAAVDAVAARWPGRHRLGFIGGRIRHWITSGLPDPPFREADGPTGRSRYAVTKGQTPDYPAQPSDCTLGVHYQASMAGWMTRPHRSVLGARLDTPNWTICKAYVLPQITAHDAPIRQGSRACPGAPVTLRTTAGCGRHARSADRHGQMLAGGHDGRRPEPVVRRFGHLPTGRAGPG